MTNRSGPLAGLRIIEMAGIGPGPFCGMMLADLGAEVIRVERPGGNIMSTFAHDTLFRSRRCIALNIKDPAGRDLLIDLTETADAIFEGNRPGVMERLGLGPEVLFARNPRLVYGRMTGWGQHGPLAQTAGHDINYIAIGGALHHFRRAGERPLFPTNVIGDFGGGGMLLAYGMVAALLSAGRTGEGQVVDAAMLDGTAALMAMTGGQINQIGPEEPGTGMLDSGAHFYEVYTSADGRDVSIGAIEPAFYAELCERLDLSAELRDNQQDRSRWPAFKAAMAERIGALTVDELNGRLLGTDACYAPILSYTEAAGHPHNVARGTFVDVDGAVQHHPAPRFSGTPTSPPEPIAPVGRDTRAILRDLGHDDKRVDALVEAGTISEAAA